MLEAIYEWIENIAFYLVMIVAVIQMVPSNSYKKYIRFFAGMILILMLAGPILKVFGMSTLQSKVYQEKLGEMEEKLKEMENIIGK